MNTYEIYHQSFCSQEGVATRRMSSRDFFWKACDVFIFNQVREQLRLLRDVAQRGTSLRKQIRQLLPLRIGRDPRTRVRGAGQQQVRQRLTVQSHWDIAYAKILFCGCRHYCKTYTPNREKPIALLSVNYALGLITCKVLFHPASPWKHTSSFPYWTFCNWTYVYIPVGWGGGELSPC